MQDLTPKSERVDAGAYKRQKVWVRLRNGRRKKAIAYVMPRIIRLDKPSKKYLGYILDGLKEWGFSKKVIATVESAAKAKG